MYITSCTINIILLFYVVSSPELFPEDSVASGNSGCRSRDTCTTPPATYMYDSTQATSNTSTSSGGSEPGPTRALARSSKLAVNFIHSKINKHFASSARINKEKDTEGVRKDE